MILRLITRKLLTIIYYFIFETILNSLNVFNIEGRWKYEKLLPYTFFLTIMYLNNSVFQFYMDEM